MQQMVYWQMQTRTTLLATPPKTMAWRLAGVLLPSLLGQEQISAVARWILLATMMTAGLLLVAQHTLQMALAEEQQDQ
jgi:hypothetical protein